MRIPGSDEPANHEEAAPPIGRMTTAMVILNVFICVWEMQMPVRALARFEHLYALNPLTAVPHGLWQFVTYQFLHGSLWHIVANLMVLHSVGPVLEEELGEARWVGLYLFSGAFGGFIQWGGAHLAPGHFDQMVVGASASICGLLAALCAIYAEEPMEVRLFFILPIKMRAKFLLLSIAVLSLVGVIYPFGRVAHLAHLGGLVGGLVGLNLLRPPAVHDRGQALR
jgi:membrane associated rhomboid family serine protease